MSRRPKRRRDWGTILTIVFLALIAFSLISYLWFPFLTFTEQRDAGEEIVEDTYDADQARQEYEWFREQYHDIEAQRAQIQNHYEELDRFYETHGEDPSEWSRQAETRHNRIQERITGNQNQLEQMVAEYNARSDQAHRSVFKCHLPYKVDERFAITGPPGSGDAEQPQDEYVEGADPSQDPPSPEQCDALPDQINTDSEDGGNQ